MAGWRATSKSAVPSCRIAWPAPSISGGTPSSFGGRVLDDAARLARGVDPDRVVAARTVRRAVAGGVGATAALAALLLVGADAVGRIARQRVAVRGALRSNADRRAGRGATGRGRAPASAGASLRHAGSLRTIDSAGARHRRRRRAHYPRHATPRRRLRGHAAARGPKLHLPRHRRDARIGALRGHCPAGASGGANRRRVRLPRVHGTRSPRRGRWR